jgi:parvulin-like peptidyl-prolyl isomerase
MKITFVHRLFLYGTIIGYVALDMNVFRGPLRRAIDDRRIGSAKSTQLAHQQGLAAVVLGRSITTAQIEYASRERVWLQGLAWDTLSKGVRDLYRKTALQDLIDHQIIRTKIKANTTNIFVEPSLFEQRWKEFTARFPNAEEMQKTLSLHGISGEPEMQLRIKASLEQDQYISRQLEPLLQVSEQEIVEFYEKHQQQLAIPERVHCRHIFWAALEKDPAQVKNTAESALAALESKQSTFEQIAAAQSEDENSKTRGGDLGWLHAGRAPADFFIPLLHFTPSLPTLLQTKLGWHLVEVLEKRPAQARSLDECREEIQHTLKDLKRKPELDRLRQALRRDHKDYIHIYQSVIDAMP